MDLELNIEQGSRSDQLGKMLLQSTADLNTIQDTNIEQFGDALEQSVTDLGKSMITDAAAGAANIVTNTGINIGVGSVDEIIADNISAAVNLTGRSGLTNLSNNLLNYTLSLTEMGLNAPEELVKLLINLLEEVLAKNGVIDLISKSMNVAKNTTDLLLLGLKVASSGVTVAGNMSKLMTLLNKMQDVEVTCIPTVKDTTSAFAASILDLIVALYTALKELLIIFYNSMICTANDSTIDNIIVSINTTLSVLEPLLDLILNDYTGYTISEVRNLCNLGLAYVGMIERAAAKSANKNNENIESIEDNENNLNNQENQEEYNI